MEALGFSADDLAANRAGQLSERQRQQLRRAHLRLMRSLIVIVSGIVLLATGALYLGSSSGRIVFTLIGITLTLVNAGLVGFAAQQRLRYRADTAAPVRAQSSTVHRVLRVSGRSPAYLIRLEGEELRVNKRVFNAFVEGERYWLYRAGSSGTLLSAEAAAP